jgi:acyl dehydratase
MADLFSSLAVGDVVATETIHLTRDSLVRYAGASGDFNPIHYRDDVAASVGLPGVLAHGMLTMGVAISPVQSWLAGSGMIRSYQVRFTRPIIVDPENGHTVSVSAAVGVINQLDDGVVESIRVDLTVTSEAGETVLGKAQVVVAPR